MLKEEGFQEVEHIKPDVDWQDKMYQYLDDQNI
jgi:hypothetical protein